MNNKILNRNRQNLLRSCTSWRAVLIMGAMAAAVGSFTLVQAAWVGPSNPPTAMGGLSSVIQSEDLISLVRLTPQYMVGPLQVTNNVSSVLKYPVIVNYQNATYNQQVGIMAVAQTSGSAATTGTSMPSNMSVGVLGHQPVSGSGIANAYGVYAVSTGAGTSAIIGRAAGAANYGAKFYGNVEVLNGTGVSGNLIVQNKITGFQLVSNGKMDFSASTPVQSGGIWGRGKLSAPVGSLGIDAVSTSGVAAIMATSTNAAIVAHGYSLSSSGAGVYGYHEDANVRADGIVGKLLSTITTGNPIYGNSVSVGVKGKGDFTAPIGATGAGVFACGTQEAGYFNNNVYVQDRVVYNGTKVMTNGYPVYSGTTYLSAADITTIITACLGAAGSQCSVTP